MSTTTLNLVLTYFHAFYGPKVLISHPEQVPDDIKKVISGFSRFPYFFKKISFLLVSFLVSCFIQGFCD